MEVDEEEIVVEDTIYLAASEGALDRVASFLSLDHEAVNRKDENGFTPLMSAVSYGHTAVAAYLIERGAKPNSKDSDGNTALHHCGSIECLHLLLAHGAIFSRNKQRETPLDVKKDELRELEEEADLDEEERDGGKMAALVEAFQQASSEQGTRPNKQPRMQDW